MGFGSGTGELWYGVQTIANLIQSEMRIDYTFTNGTKRYLLYNNFRVGPVTKQYLLTISGIDAVTTDPFYINPTHLQWSLDQMNFTTRDRDNDHQPNGHNCAVHNNGHRGSGKWWYNFCSDIVINNQYNHMYSIRFNGKWHPLSFVEMKIRPKYCIIQLHQ